MIQTMKLSRLANDLGLALETHLAQALQREAAAIAASLVETLATPPGGPHQHPWQQTGTLHDSIETEITATEAIIASTDPVALIQEHGTTTIPPRPSFGPLAALAAPGIAHRIGEAALHALIGD